MFSISKRRGDRRPGSRRPPNFRKCSFEPLEPRSLLSASGGLDTILAQPLLDPLARSVTPIGYAPAQIAQAYQAPTGQSFVSPTATPYSSYPGYGQTIAIVDAYDNPTLARDLATFNSYYHLPPMNQSGGPTLTKINQSGGTKLPKANAGWGLEIALDVQWAHAMAPGASIVLVEASSNSLANLLTAVDTASSRSGVHQVSLSWGSSEFASESSYDYHFKHPGVTYVAAAGDSGAPAIWPAVSPNVVGVGGTTLTSVDPNRVLTGSSAGESSWSGGGGGPSLYETKPGYQSGVTVAGVSSTARLSPDVSYNANPSSGVAVYDSYGYRGWIEVGGTSAGAPQWASLIAIVNQHRGSAGALNNTLADLYTLYPSQAANFYDIQTGSNGYSATVGYDLVTGLGSPRSGAIITALTGASAKATVSVTTGTGSSQAIRQVHRWSDQTILAAVFRSPTISAAPTALVVGSSIGSLPPAQSPAGIPRAGSAPFGLDPLGGSVSRPTSIAILDGPSGGRIAPRGEPDVSPTLSDGLAAVNEGPSPTLAPLTANLPLTVASTDVDAVDPLTLATAPFRPASTAAPLTPRAVDAYFAEETAAYELRNGATIRPPAASGAPSLATAVPALALTTVLWHRDAQQLPGDRRVRLGARRAPAAG